MSLVFQYKIEFPDFALPPGRKDSFEQRLSEFLRIAGFDFAIGALGGSKRTYGHVGRKGGDVLPSDRIALRDWLVKQPIKAVVRIGPLEPEDGIDLLTHITGTVLEVDNLTDDDRSQAAEYLSKITKLIQQRAKRPPETG